jgi:general secretion pathway protein M
MKEKLQAWWKALSQRERRAIGAMGMVLALVLLWQLGIAMPSKSLRETALQRQQAQAEWDQVQTLRAQALALRARSADAAASTMSGTAILQTLKTATAAAGDARAQVNEIAPGSFSVRFEQVSPEALGRWLQTVRQQARLLPQNADLQRVSAAPVAWRGSIMLGGS